MNEKIDFSVIIPFYNAECYLEDCLQSMVCQANENFNFEVLLIDDGSADNSTVIAERYCGHYPYMHLYKKEQGGVSSARNYGMKIARGKYFTFVDSDDYVVSNIYYSVFKILENNPIDGFYFGFTSNLEKLESFDEKFYYVKRRNSVKSAVWRMVYKKEIVDNNNLTFHEDIKYSEDFLFNYKYILCSQIGIAGTAERLYFYRIHDNNATQMQNFTDEKISSYVASYEAVLSEIFNVSPNKKDELYLQVINQSMSSYLWTVFKFNLDSTGAISYLNSIGLDLKVIDRCIYEGDGWKYKFKSYLQYLFRYKVFFVMCCKAKKILSRS